MSHCTFSIALTGVVPATCDAEAGEADRLSTDVPPGEVSLACGLADPSRMARLLRRIGAAGPGIWRRVRITASSGGG